MVIITRVTMGVFAFASLAALSTASAGCYSSWDIAPKSLESLNGYHYPEPQPRMVADGLTDLLVHFAPIGTINQKLKR